MASFEPGDVIKVPFLYTARPTRQSRPALVVSAPALEDGHGLLWVVMITSAENRGWPGDVAVRNLDMAGLPVASLVRTAKIATIESADAQRLGRVSAGQCSWSGNTWPRRWARPDRNGRGSATRPNVGRGPLPTGPCASIAPGV